MKNKLKDNKLKKSEIEVLCALHQLLALEPKLLDKYACDRYNELVARADEENLVW